MRAFLCVKDLYLRIPNQRRKQMPINPKISNRIQAIKKKDSVCKEDKFDLLEDILDEFVDADNIGSVSMKFSKETLEEIKVSK